MILLHLDVDLEILRQRRPRDSLFRVIGFTHKRVSHQCDMALAAVLRADCVSIKSSFSVKFLKVVLECEVRRQDVEAEPAGIQKGVIGTTLSQIGSSF